MCIFLWTQRKPESSSVPSQKFVYEVFAEQEAVTQPHEGRNIVAQGASPGFRGPHLAFSPSPARAGEGTGMRVRVGFFYLRLAPAYRRQAVGSVMSFLRS